MRGTETKQKVKRTSTTPDYTEARDRFEQKEHTRPRPTNLIEVQRKTVYAVYLRTYTHTYIYAGQPYTYIPNFGNRYAR